MKNLKILIIALSCLTSRLYSMENEAEEASVERAESLKEELSFVKAFISDLGLEDLSDKDITAIPLYDNFQKKVNWIRVKRKYKETVEKNPALKQKYSKLFSKITKEEIQDPKLTTMVWDMPITNFHRDEEYQIRAQNMDLIDIDDVD